MGIISRASDCDNFLSDPIHPTIWSPFSVPHELSRPTVESGDRRAISRFRRRFAVVLASGVLVGVGGGGRPAESAADWSPLVYSFLYSRVRVTVAPTGWLLLLLLLLSAVGGCWGGGFGDVVGESAAPGSGEASWRIKEELGRSGLRVSFPDLVGFFVCRSLPMAGSHGFFCALAAAGSCRSARMSVLRGGSGNCYGDGTGAAVRRLAYSCLEEPGWRFFFRCLFDVGRVTSRSWSASPPSPRRWIQWAFIDSSVHRLLRCANCCQGWLQKS